MKLGKNVNLTDNWERNAIHLAAERDNGRLIDVLVSVGVDVTKCDIINRTPLHIAGHSGCHGAVNTLITNHNSNPLAQDKYGNTPYHWAIYGFYKIAGEYICDEEELKEDEHEDQGMSLRNSGSVDDGIGECDVGVIEDNLSGSDIASGKLIDRRDSLGKKLNKSQRRKPQSRCLINEEEYRMAQKLLKAELLREQNEELKKKQKRGRKRLSKKERAIEARQLAEEEAIKDKWLLHDQKYNAALAKKELKRIKKTINERKQQLEDADMAKVRKIAEKIKEDELNRVDEEEDEDFEHKVREFKATCRSLTKSLSVSDLLVTQNKSGWNVFHQAAVNGNIYVMRLLVKLSTDFIEFKEKSGNTPLHLACRRNYRDTVAYLVEEVQANVNVKNLKGKTPLNYALRKGNLQIAKVLVTNGAQLSDGDLTRLAFINAKLTLARENEQRKRKVMAAVLSEDGKMKLNLAEKKK